MRLLRWLAACTTAFAAGAFAIETPLACAEQESTGQVQQGAAETLTGEAVGQGAEPAGPRWAAMMTVENISLDALGSFVLEREKVTYQTGAAERRVYRASGRCGIEHAGVDGANLYISTSCGEVWPYSNYLLDFNRRMIAVVPYAREGDRMTFGRAREYRAELCSVEGGVFKDERLIVLDECGGYVLLTVWDSEEASPRSQFIEPGERVRMGGTAALVALPDGNVAVLAFVEHECGPRLVVQAYSPELRFVREGALCLFEGEGEIGSLTEFKAWRDGDLIRFTVGYDQYTTPVLWAAGAFDNSLNVVSTEP
jgi:hypothetical protein